MIWTVYGMTLYATAFPPILHSSGQVTVLIRESGRGASLLEYRWTDVAGESDPCYLNSVMGKE